MSVTIRRLGKRLRSIADLRHKPSGWGKGKWQSMSTFWAYKMKSRRLRKIAAESRRRNRT